MNISSTRRSLGYQAAVLPNVMLLSLLCFYSIVSTGCQSGKVSGQPHLHSPYQPWTNQPKPTAKDTSYSTNTSATSERIFKDNGTNLMAFIQISSDADVAEEFGNVFAQCFYVGEVIIENQGTNTFLAYGASIDVNVAYYVSQADWDKNDDLRALMFNRFGKDYILSHRRPSTYSDILAIFEKQRRGNPKQLTIDHMKSAGEIATAATVFVGGPLYPKIVGFATGVFTTELEKRLLWDIMLHAKNLESRSLKEVEEVPELSSIHRLVFFPKRGIPGIVDGYLVYISSFTDQSSQSSQARQPVLIAGALIKKTQHAATAEVGKFDVNGKRVLKGEK